MKTHTVYITGKRLQVTARRLGFDFTEEVEWIHVSRHYPARRVVTGILIAPENDTAMREAISKIASKPKKTYEQKLAARERKERKECNAFASNILARFPSMEPRAANIIAAHTCETGSGRVGRSSTAEDPIMAAVVAHVRHEYTDYETLLDAGYSREEARSEVGKTIREQIQEWQQIATQAA